MVGRFAAHALRAVRQFAWREVDSGKMALSHLRPSAATLATYAGAHADRWAAQS